MVRYTLLDDTTASGHTTRVARCICVLMALQFTSFALCRAHIPNDQCDSVSLLYGEVIKALVSVVILFRSGSQRLCHDIHLAFIPVACFCTMNLLSFWALRRVSAALFVVILQLKLVWTAFFSYLLIGRVLSHVHVLTMIGISVGVALVSLPSDEDQLHKTEPWGVAALVVETMLSGFSAAFTQMSFRSELVTMWTRNAQMATLSSMVYCAIAFSNSCDANPTTTGMLFAVISALGGLLVALTILFVGAIEKTITTNVSMVLTFVIESVVFQQKVRLDKMLMCASVLVYCTIFARLPKD